MKQTLVKDIIWEMLAKKIKIGKKVGIFKYDWIEANFWLT